MTPTKSNEKIKLYLVIALTLVAAVVAYFRFVHKGAGPVAPAPVADAPSPRTQSDLNPVNPARPHRLRASRPVPTGPFRMDIRDIFAPLELPPDPKPVAQPQSPILSKPMVKAPGAAPPAPPLNVELRGTVVGGNEPLALINDKFVRLGEKVGEYQVIGITPSAVHLKAGNHQKVIHVVPGAVK